MNNNDLEGIKQLEKYFKEQASQKEGRSIPPLDKWHPEREGEMDLLIKSNGEWWHEGSKMTRQSLVDLFATILWKEEINGEAAYYLKTPVEKLRIQVEDAPLLIDDVGIVEEEGLSWIEFTTSTGDVVRLDSNHPLYLGEYLREHSGVHGRGSHHEKDDNNEKDEKGEMRPYMVVRNNLEALIARHVYYHLIEIGDLVETADAVTLKLQSGGQTYEIQMDK